MPKINREEYEVLKSYISEEKYIAKDRDGSIRLLTDYPERDMKREEWSDGWGKSTLKNSANNFQFIQWEDEEPHNIAELIEKYESSQMTYFDRKLISEYEWLTKESEETEVKKDKKWAQKEVDRYLSYEGVNEARNALTFAKGVINQLDEPEVLSQEEVDQAYKDGYEKGKQHTFYKGYLEGLADKENEPETVADVVTTFWKSFERLKEVMSMEVEEMEE